MKTKVVHAASVDVGIDVSCKLPPGDEFAAKICGRMEGNWAAAADAAAAAAAASTFSVGVAEGAADATACNEAKRAQRSSIMLCSRHGTANASVTALPTSQSPAFLSLLLLLLLRFVALSAFSLHLLFRNALFYSIILFSIYLRRFVAGCI